MSGVWGFQCHKVCDIENKLLQNLWGDGRSSFIWRIFHWEEGEKVITVLLRLIVFSRLGKCLSFSVADFTPNDGI